MTSRFARRIRRASLEGFGSLPASCRRSAPCLLAVTLLAGCPQKLPAPITTAADAEAEGERVGPTWLPGPLETVHGGLGLGDVALMAYAQLPEPDDNWRPTPEDPGPTATLRLVAVTTAGQEETWLELDSGFSGCAATAELAEIPGVSGAGVYMAQLVCERGTGTTRVDSLTTLVQIRPAEGRVEVLWRGDGWSVSTDGNCLDYQVYSFRGAEDGSAVQVLRDEETVRTGTDLEVDCREREFRQTPMQVVNLETFG